MLNNTILTLESAYSIEARNRQHPEWVIHGCTAGSIEELSRFMPISIETGIDHATQHADIYNPGDWEVIVKKLDARTGTWKEIPDPRIYKEELTIS